MLDVDKALKELRSSTLSDIERATALTWGARAVASFRLCAEAGDWEERLRCFLDGENYRQEAMEHAAMSDDWKSLLPGIESEIDQARAAAETAMQFAKPRTRTANTGAGA